MYREWRFLQPFDTMPFLLAHLVEGAERVFDTLYGASGIVGIDMSRVGPCAANEQVGHRRARFVAAQDIESLERCPQPRRKVITA